MSWIQNILKFKGQFIQSQSDGVKSPIRAILLKIYSSVQFYDQSLSKVINQNKDLLSFIINRADQADLAEQEANDDNEDPLTTIEWLAHSN